LYKRAVFAFNDDSLAIIPRNSLLILMFWNRGRWRSGRNHPPSN